MIYAKVVFSVEETERFYQRGNPQINWLVDNLGPPSQDHFTGEISSWVVDVIRGGYRFRFAKASDAVMFKLVWGGQ